MRTTKKYNSAGAAWELRRRKKQSLSASVRRPTQAKARQTEPPSKSEDDGPGACSLPAALTLKQLGYSKRPPHLEGWSGGEGNIRSHKNRSSTPSTKYPNRESSLRIFVSGMRTNKLRQNALDPPQ